MDINKEEFWAKCLSYIQTRIPGQAFQTWFDDVTVSAISQEEITLLVPNQFHYEWLESKYRHLIDSAIKSSSLSDGDSTLPIIIKLLSSNFVTVFEILLTKSFTSLDP